MVPPPNREDGGSFVLRCPLGYEHPIQRTMGDCVYEPCRLCAKTSETASLCHGRRAKVCPRMMMPPTGCASAAPREHNKRSRAKMRDGRELLTRAVGTLIIDQGVIIRAFPEDENRTWVEFAPGIDAGYIVRDLETGQWCYDSQMRTVLGITKNPHFETDGEAGDSLQDYLPPLSELNELGRQTIRETRSRRPNGAG